MKNCTRLVIALAATGIVVPAKSAAQKQPLHETASIAEVEATVRSVVSDFKEALRAGDSLAVIDLLHPDAKIYEGGHAETRDQYRNGHLRSDIAFLSAVTSRTSWERVVPGHDLALYMSEYTMQGEYRGREIDSRGTETVVLVPTEAGWRIRHIHWSSR